MDARIKKLLATAVRPCVLGCEHGEDDVHHYLRCRVYWSFVSRQRPSGLGVTSCPRCPEAALLVHEALTQEDRVRMAIGTYALYRTVQECRHHPYPASLDCSKLLKIWARRGADDSRASSLLYVR